jgi:hypothetical protein
MSFNQSSYTSPYNSSRFPIFTHQAPSTPTNTLNTFPLYREAIDSSRNRNDRRAKRILEARTRRAVGNKLNEQARQQRLQTRAAQEIMSLPSFGMKGDKSISGDRSISGVTDMMEVAGTPVHTRNNMSHPFIYFSNNVANAQKNRSNQKKRIIQQRLAYHPDRDVMDFVTKKDPMVKECLFSLGEKLNSNGVKETFVKRCEDEILALRKAKRKFNDEQNEIGKFGSVSNEKSFEIMRRATNPKPRPDFIDNTNIIGILSNNIVFHKLLFYYIDGAFMGYKTWEDVKNTPRAIIVKFMNTMASHMISAYTKGGDSRIIQKRELDMGYAPRELSYPLPNDNSRAQDYLNMRGIDLFHRMTVLVSGFMYDVRINNPMIDNEQSLITDLTDMIDSIAAFACYCIYYMERGLYIVRAKNVINPSSIIVDVIKFSNSFNYEKHGGKRNKRTLRRRQLSRKRHTRRKKH